MKIIDQLNNLEIFTNKITESAKDRREKQKAFRFLVDWHTQIFLDLFEERGGKIDYNKDPLFLKLSSITDNFYKLMR
jgi:hypothetical protein